MDKIGILHLAQQFALALSEQGLPMDYSLDSLKEVEDYIQKTFSNNGQPKSNSFFYGDTEDRTLEYGCYVGEVVRRNGTDLKWKMEDIQSPMEITLTNAEDANALVIGKAFKRIFQGEEDNCHFFARVLLSDHLKTTQNPPEGFFDDDDKKINQFSSSPLVIYSKSIEENGGIIDRIHFEGGRWLFTNEKGKGKEFDFLFMDEVKLKHPEIADLLVEDGKLLLVRQDDGTYRSQKGHEGLFYDGNTMAEFQGDMSLSVVQWIRFNTFTVLKNIGWIAIGFFLMKNLHWGFGIVLIGAILYNVWYWFMQKNKFKGGDVNPGKVLSVNPTLVAVATNLTKYGEDYPILKIIETKLPEEDNILNNIVPTIALYNDNPHGYPFWSEFHPVPVIHGISDKNKIESIMSQFSKDKFEMLDRYIEQVKIKESGIYKIDENTSDWVDYKYVDISKGVSMEGPDKKGDA